MAEDRESPRRLSQVFDPLSRLGELTRETRSTPASPRLLPRRPREPVSVGVVVSQQYDGLDHPGSSTGDHHPSGSINGINWQERCFELQLELQRSRAQATRTRDMLREKKIKALMLPWLVLEFGLITITVCTAITLLFSSPYTATVILLFSVILTYKWFAVYKYCEILLPDESDPINPVIMPEKSAVVA